MYVLDLLKQSNSDALESGSDVAFEYRLLCSGELYNSNLVTADWRKNDAT
jgi:hypothetical protein